MKKILIAFLTITILPILAYGYVNESDCGDINNCPAGCGISSAGTAPVCNICPAGTYSSQADAFINPHYVCQSCGNLPEQDHTILSWYKSGAENIDECKYTFKCETGYIINPEYQQVLALTNNIISINDHYTEICSVKCGLNSYPNENKTACVCKTGTYVKGTTNDTETTDGTDCTPYIITIVTNNPDIPQSPSQSIDVLTILNQDTYLYSLKIDDIDSPITISHGDTLYTPSSLRKVLWGDKEKVYENHIDTGYKIKSWLDSNNPSKEFAAFSNITTNYSLRPNWVGKTFQITIQHTDGTSTTATECEYNTQCTINVPTTLRGHTFSHWNCETHDYKENPISCTTPDIYPVDGTSPDLSNVSYGNDIVLTENWEPNKITIFYKTKSNPTGAIITATDTYNYGKEYILQAPGNMDTPWDEGAIYILPKGYKFANWTCTTVDEDNNPIGDCGTFNAGTDISKEFESGYVRMTANYVLKNIYCGSGNYLPKGSEDCTTCPAGYYCENEELTYNEETDSGLYPCPAGSTSAAGSKAITNCYITDQTKICDNNDNCFQIPKDKKIYHN